MIPACPPRLVLVALCLLAAATPGLRAGSVPANVAPDAWAAAEVGPAEILIRLREKADLSLAETLVTREDKGRFVTLALRTTAERSQKDLRAWLIARGVQFQPFYIVNAVWARADRATIAAVAARPDVDRVIFNPRVRGIEGATEALGRVPELPGGVVVPQSIEWNVDRVNAPAAWAEGHRGEGIVVGNQDTGMRWTHEVLKPRYRGWDEASGIASHDYNWHDSIHPPATGGICGTDSVEPCDDGGHGTHTTGTAVGSDGGANEVGVAPGAQWIGCRNMDEGWGTPATYLECFEFFLAPYPVGGDPSMGDPLLAPDLTTNSWLCPPSEGCAWDVLQDATIAQRAAGIMTVVAAGNSGSACGSIDSPAAVYDASYTVGATNGSDAVTGFSSRGPSTQIGLMKPDIVAPGAGVRSGTAGGDNTYGSWNGTSMATPHVAGVVALVWSARPAYRGHVAETEELLNVTARRLPAIVESCGGDYVVGPNGTWGHGLIDVAAALAGACPPFETICDDGFDSDCDGLLDCLDSDCLGAAECPEALNCADGLDNDLDAAVDCDDVDCDPTGECAEAGRCEDGRDNDADGLVDCADMECNGDVACPESSYCSDAVDNDLDDLVDCEDADCAGDPACPESDWCSDGLDNDADGAADCDDADCDPTGACREAGRCSDLRDNDADGRPDCADADCNGDSACPESLYCSDGVDNDLDGSVDCADADCGGDPACPESAWCSDGLDQDRDGLIDCTDPDCNGDTACPEGIHCGDGLDNDLDGLVDCFDSDCVASPDCPERGRCTDGIDNDGNGAADCADPACAGDPACPEAGRCLDGLDNDLDGATDCDDADCVADPDCGWDDTDGDGRINADDCLPVDPTAFDVAPEVPLIDVARRAGVVTVSWLDVSAAGGTGTRYEVAGATLAVLHASGFAAMPCVARGVAALEWSVSGALPEQAFLVRAVTACGPGAAQGWGLDSLGRERLACP